MNTHHKAAFPGPEDDAQLLGAKLRQAREYIGLGQEQVAKQLGIPHGGMSDLEQGRRSVSGSELTKLSRLYQRPVQYFTSEGSRVSGVVALDVRSASPLSSADRLKLRHFADFLQAKPKRRPIAQQAGRRPTLRDPERSDVDVIGSGSRDQNRQFILRGKVSATRLLGELGYDRGAKRTRRVNVFDTIYRRGITLMFQPLDKLLGAFVKQNGEAGIILNTECSLCIQRFAAAHVLGHLILGHDPHADEDDILRRGPITDDRICKKLSPEDREADAFASYFLLPSHVITAQMEAQGWDFRHFSSPDVIYQASLRFGVGYTAAVYGLEREKLISRDIRQTLLEAEPVDLKLKLLDGQEILKSCRGDVWVLTERDEGAVIEAGRNDLFLLCLEEATGAGYVWTFDELEATGFAILRDARQPGPKGQIGSPTVHRILVQAKNPTAKTMHLTECRPWEPMDEPRQLTIHCRTANSYKSGLFEHQRLEKFAL